MSKPTDIFQEELKKSTIRHLESTNMLVTFVIMVMKYCRNIINYSGSSTFEWELAVVPFHIVADRSLEGRQSKYKFQSQPQQCTYDNNTQYSKGPEASRKLLPAGDPVLTYVGYEETLWFNYNSLSFIYRLIASL